MRRIAWLAALAAGVASTAASAEDAFRLIELPGPGRTAAAGLADLDGDGRSDVYTVALFGLPPRQRRELRIHFQRDDGTLRAGPDWAGDLPEGSAAYDVADLDGVPGQEFLLLRRDRVTALSFPARAMAARDLPIPGDPTFAVATDERGLDPLRMAVPGLGDGLRLLVPGLGECIVLSPAGEVIARLDVGHRANYFVPLRPGPVLGESEIESYLDFPRLEVGDVDGDGRRDIVAAGRYEVRVFLQRDGGGFTAAPDRRLVLGRLTEQDLIRGSGSVRVGSGDLDGDDRLDLIVSTTRGGLVNARTETTIHLNRGGAWDLAKPDRELVLERGWSTQLLTDVDGDGRVELIEASVPFSVLELVETLLTREVDVEIALYRVTGGEGFGLAPAFRHNLSIALDFDSYRPKGFAPTIEADVNGDGHRDRIDSAQGEAVEVYLGGGDAFFGARTAVQPLDARGSIRFGDLDGDRLTDLLLFSPDRPDSTVRVLVNCGVLPGTRHPAQLTAPDEGGP
jgi:hypothetical protein